MPLIWTNILLNQPGMEVLMANPSTWKVKEVDIVSSVSFGYIDGLWTIYITQTRSQQSKKKQKQVLC